MFKSVETRLVSPWQYSMTEGVMLQEKVLKSLVKDELFLVLLSKQYPMNTGFVLSRMFSVILPYTFLHPYVISNVSTRSVILWLKPPCWQWEDIDKLSSDKKFWTTIKVYVKVLQPAGIVLCYSDGMHGGNLGLVYNLLMKLDQI
jgi:hypothetical protein